MVKIRWISFRDVFTCERTDTRDQEKFRWKNGEICKIYIFMEIKKISSKCIEIPCLKEKSYQTRETHTLRECMNLLSKAIGSFL